MQRMFMKNPEQVGGVGSLLIATLCCTILPPATLAGEELEVHDIGAAVGETAAMEDLKRFVLDCESRAQSDPPMWSPDIRTCSIAYEALKVRFGGWEAYHRWWWGARQSDDGSIGQ